MKKRVLGFIIGLILLLAFVVGLAPARVVLPWVGQSIPQMSLNNPDGTIWNASLGSLVYQGLVIEDISVQTSFWSLLLGNVSSAVQVNDEKLIFDGNIKLNRHQFSITSARYQLDASSILNWFRLPITELSGRFIGQVDSIDLTSGNINSLQANGYWQNAVVGYPASVLELGDIHFTLSKTEDDRALLTITDNPGMLDLKGTLEVGFDKQYQLNVNTQSDIPSNIKQWLTQLGQTENNRIYIKWNGRLP